MAIQENLKKILSSRFGKDVRKAIHDSIHDCYQDGKAGVTDLIARERLDVVEETKATRSELSTEIGQTKAEIDIERKRINEFTKLPEGSTAGDAETADIRVGADGKTYESAGEAVRGQVKQLSDWNDARNEKNSNDLMSGKYALIDIRQEIGTTKDGTTVNTDVAGCISEFISVIPYEKMYVRTRGNEVGLEINRYHGVYYYDTNKNVIGYETPEFKKFALITIPRNCYYIRVQWLYDNEKNLKCTREIRNADVFADVYNKLDELLMYSFKYEKDEYSVDSKIKMFNGYYLTKEGFKIKVNDWNCTDFISIWDVHNIYITNQKPWYGNPSILFYNKNKQVVHYTEDENTKQNFTIEEIQKINPDIEFIRVSSIGDVIIERKQLFSSHAAFEEIFNEIDEIKKELSKYKYENDLKIFIDITPDLNLTNGYLTDDGTFLKSESCRTTDYVDINSYDEIYVTGNLQQAGASAWAIYDINKKFITKQEAVLGNVKLYEIDLNAILLENPTAKYIRISSYYTSQLFVGTFVLPDMSELYNVFASQNVLFGKKYVSCGDSFTAGAFGKKYPKEEYYDNALQSWKTYPWYIAKRNNMFLVNESISGSTMYDNGDDNAFSVSRYKKIPEDADYITLMFGLNDINAPIGTIDDSDNTTVMGAWNVVLEYLIEHHPFAKIGIIISDAWLNQELYNALIEISKAWGVPYLDLKNDEKVPLGIGGRLNIPVKQKAKDLRNNTFQMGTSDSHPNPKAHEYRSTIVENFLRSL